eukprot:scaffold568932_cov53-Prasinocladus_malaysianus.AAC.1
MEREVLSRPVPARSSSTCLCSIWGQSRAQHPTFSHLSQLTPLHWWPCHRQVRPRPPTGRIDTAAPAREPISEVIGDPWQSNRQHHRAHKPRANSFTGKPLD